MLQRLLKVHQQAEREARRPEEPKAEPEHVARTDARHQSKRTPQLAITHRLMVAQD
jgi:hypothetical protein